MKLKTATFIGYSYDASYYINNDATGYDYYNEPGNHAGDGYQKNADAVYNEIKAIYGPGAYIVDCGQETFFSRPDYGMQLQGDCIEYTVLYNPIEAIAEKRVYSFLHSDGEQITGASWNLKNGLTFPTRENLLPWQARGLMYTASGYGKKIPTTKQLFILGRWRRVYCDIFSNSGVCYVIIDNQEVNVDSCNMEALQ
jgi:hypothetical protein